MGNTVKALAGMAQDLSAGWTGGRPADLSLLVRFPVKTQAWVAYQIPSWGCARGNRRMFLLHTDVSLPLSPSLPHSLKINKI